MCHRFNPSTLPMVDCYWLMRQWASRIKQERPVVKESELKGMLTRWWIARWRLNTAGVNLAVHNLGNAIMAYRTFEEENAELREAV